MYSKVQEEVFEGIITAALNEYIIAENALLPSDEELSQMYPVSKKKLKKYKRKASERKYGIPMPFVYIRRVAVVFLVVISVSFCALVTNGEVRAAIVNAVVKWYGEYVQISFSQLSNESEENDDSVTEDTAELIKIPDFKDINIGYVPKGYELISSTEESDLREYMYSAENGDYMIIGIYVSNTADIAADVEFLKYEIISINGNETYLFYDEAERCGALISGNNKFTIWINAISDKSDIIKVAENIK